MAATTCLKSSIEAFRFDEQVDGLLDEVEVGDADAEVGTLEDVVGNDVEVV